MAKKPKWKRGRLTHAEQDIQDAWNEISLKKKIRRKALKQANELMKRKTGKASADASRMVKMADKLKRDIEKLEKHLPEQESVTKETKEQRQRKEELEQWLEEHEEWSVFWEIQEPTPEQLQEYKKKEHELYLLEKELGLIKSVEWVKLFSGEATDDDEPEEENLIEQWTRELQEAGEVDRKGRLINKKEKEKKKIEKKDKENVKEVEDKQAAAGGKKINGLVDITLPWQQDTQDVKNLRARVRRNMGLPPLRKKKSKGKG